MAPLRIAEEYRRIAWSLPAIWQGMTGDTPVFCRNRLNQGGIRFAAEVE
jgi:hypothetical protein